MRLSIRMEEFSEVTERLQEVIIAGTGSIEAVSNFVARSTAQRAKLNIRTGAKTGRVYYRKNPDRIVQASAPGESPADDLGYLADSISFRLFSTSGMVGYVFANASYAMDLEFGNPSIAPRPFFYPAYEEAVMAAAGRFKVEFESRL